MLKTKITSLILVLSKLKFQLVGVGISPDRIQLVFWAFQYSISNYLAWIFLSTYIRSPYFFVTFVNLASIFLRLCSSRVSGSIRKIVTRRSTAKSGEGDGSVFHFAKVRLTISRKTNVVYKDKV